MTAIGLFDSGVGGLSVLRDLLRQIPSVRCVYLADNAFAPYGERSVEAIQTRANVITHWLREQHRIDALVIACNTATAHAVDRLRQRHPDLPIIGIEPALKPAAALSATGHIGVLAKRATLNSERFTALCERVRTRANACERPHLPSSTSSASLAMAWPTPSNATMHRPPSSCAHGIWRHCGKRNRKVSRSTRSCSAVRTIRLHVMSCKQLVHPG